MPITVGNLKTQTLDSMLATELAASIRQSIINGTYQYCNEKFCGVIINDLLNPIETLPPVVRTLINDSTQFCMPTHISLQGDRTCNLSCPSCRLGIIKTPEEQLQSQRDIGKLLYNNLFSRPNDQKIVVETSGTGEFFASELLISFVNSIDQQQFPQLKLHIGTNGLLAPTRWNRVNNLDQLAEKITVSIDAVTAGTYEKLRRGGQWNDLLDSMQFFKNKKQQIGAKLHTRMIVQQQNYCEMVEFYHFCKAFDVDVVEYSRLTNWGTWSHSQFRNEDVFDISHPLQQQAQQQLDQVKKLSDTWFCGL
jgi:MoaA/NifB/PqqE/SkfB family radical SAM enzyme